MLLTDEERLALLRAEARRGLTASPKQLPPKWFYDERGSALFEEITRQPEYYLTRREREILLDRAGEIAHVTLATTLIELGSGSSEKTRLLIDALRGEESLRRFMPFDVCLPFVRDAAGAIAARLSRGWTSTRSSATSTNTFASCRAIDQRRRRWSLSWAARSATSTTTERTRFFRALRRRAAPGRLVLAGRRPGQGQAPARRRLQRRRRA